MEHNLKARESRVRSAAIRAGYRLKKATQGHPSVVGHGGYMLVDSRLTFTHDQYVVLGDEFSASLDDIETYLAHSAGRRDSDTPEGNGGQRDDVRFAELMEQVRASHAHLAAFAREAFASAGRGVVQVTFEDPSSHSRTAQQTIDSTTYYPIEEVRRLVTQSLNTDASPLLRMLETYDPEHQAVVLAAFPTSTPTSFKIRLDVPLKTHEGSRHPLA